MNQCACGSKIEFTECCKPYLEGKRKPPTAEALMRARYTAFTLADVDYIENTTYPSSRSTFDREGTQQWAENSEWKGLEILKTHDGKEGDSTGTVEFIAHYKIGDQSHDHHEKAEFKTRDGQWYFVDGKYVREPYRAEEKAGRNDPCPCGSGKKYKKCCGQ